MNSNSSHIEIPSFRTSFKGYNQRGVDEFLEEWQKNYKGMLPQNEALKEEVRKLKEEIDEYASKKGNLEDALISAQKSAQLISENSQDRAKLIIKDAEIKGKELLEEARKELQGLKGEVAKIREQKRLFLTKLKSLIKSHSELAEFYEEEVPQKETLIQKKVKVRRQVFEGDELPLKERDDGEKEKPISQGDDEGQAIIFDEE